MHRTVELWVAAFASVMTSAACTAPRDAEHSDSARAPRADAAAPSTAASAASTVASSAAPSGARPSGLRERDLAELIGASRRAVLERYGPPLRMVHHARFTRLEAPRDCAACTTIAGPGLLLLANGELDYRLDARETAAEHASRAARERECLACWSRSIRAGDELRALERIAGQVADASVGTTLYYVDARPTWRGESRELVLDFDARDRCTSAVARED